MKKKGRTLRVITLSLAAVIAIGALVGATASETPESDPVEVSKEITVEVVTPQRGDLTVLGEYIGTMEPNQQITVYPKAAGEVLAVHFNIGDVVEAGDVLFEIDSKTLQSSISQTQAAVWAAQTRAQQNLAIAENNLATQEFNVENGHDSTLKAAQNAIDAARAAVDSARNRLDTAQAAYSSARRQLRDFRDDETYPVSMAALQASGGYEDQIEDQLRDASNQANLAVEAAALALEQAESNLIKAEEGYKTAEVMVQEQQIATKNQIELARLGNNFSDQYIAIEKLQNDLENYTVTAPIGGVIERRSVEPFNMASPQMAAFVISDKDSMTVTFKIPKSTYHYLQPGDPVTLDDGGATYRGTVSEISTMVDQNGLFTVKATVLRPPSHLYTGASVKLTAPSQKAENALLLPLNAISYDNGTPYVLVADNNIARKVMVETGIYDAETVQIISGLTEKSQVISSWGARLSDGAEIVILGEQPVEEATASTEQPTSQSISDVEQPSTQSTYPTTQPAEETSSPADLPAA